MWQAIVFIHKIGHISDCILWTWQVKLAHFHSRVYISITISFCHLSYMPLNNKRKVEKLNDDFNLSTITTSSSYDNVKSVTPPSTNNKRITDIQNLVRTNFFETRKVKILFNCRNNETNYDCLSRRVDHFNLILNNEVNISTIVNKANKKIVSWIYNKQL